MTGITCSYTAGRGRSAPLPCELVPKGVTGGISRIERHETWMHPAERLQSQGWSEGRRREFAAGRTLLRQLMQRAQPILGAQPILRGPTGAPVPPAGWRCSLAHDDHAVVAVATPDLAIGSLGVDVECFGAVEPALVGEIVRDDDEVHDATLAFVIKEATYKAWYRQGRRIIGFHDVRICVDGGAFRSVVMDPPVTVLAGRYHAVGGRWVAVAIGSGVA